MIACNSPSLIWRPRHANHTVRALMSSFTKFTHSSILEALQCLYTWRSSANRWYLLLINLEDMSCICIYNEKWSGPRADLFETPFFISNQIEQELFGPITYYRLSPRNALNYLMEGAEKFKFLRLLIKISCIMEYKILLQSNNVKSIIFLWFIWNS